LLLVASCCVLLSRGANIGSQLLDGFEVIFLDQPGFVHDFHYNWVTNKFYAFGQGIFRQIDHTPTTGFMATDNSTLSVYDQQFIDVRLFSPPNRSDLWAAGPSYGNGFNIGYYLPITVAGPASNDLMIIQGQNRGYTFYGVSVDARTFSHVLIYLVGWLPARPTDTHKDSVNFGIVRAHLDLTLPPAQRNIIWNATTDEVIFHIDNFHPYHATTRPHVIHDYQNNKIFVVDTHLKKIYSAIVPADGTSPMSPGGSLEIEYGEVAGSTWHYYADILYIGFSGVGRSGSTLVAADLRSMHIANKYAFPQNYSNPRAIAGQNRTIFIGFEGGPAIVKFDVLDWKIVGIQRLPEYLHQVYAAWDSGFDHIYFSTYEQHSRIFRLHKLDFCENECHYNGYCEAQICRCNTGYELSSGNCVIPPKKDTVKEVETGAAIAMGILFAIATVAAIVGWTLFYRKNKEGYTRVL